MNLYAWQPKGHGELSFFVMAETLDDAIRFVKTEIDRRKNLEYFEDDFITEYEFGRFGTDYYDLTVVGVGVVLINNND